MSKYNLAIWMTGNYVGNGSIAAFLVATLVVFVLSSCSRSGGEVRNFNYYMVEARSYYERGDFKKAKQSYTEALNLNSESAAALLGRSIVNLRDVLTYEEAIADATRALDIDASLEDAYVVRASALVDMGHSEHSQFKIMHNMAVKKKLTGALTNYWLLSPEERHERAIADATKAIEIDQNSPDAYFVRAHAYMDLKRPVEASADFDKVFELRPGAYLATMTYIHRSQAQRQSGNLVSAIDDSNKAIQLHNTLTNEFDKQVSHIKWHGFGPNQILATSYTNRGLAYKESGQAKESIDDYTRALEEDPEYFEALVNRSDVYMGTGFYEKALTDADKAISLKDKVSESLLARAYNSRALAANGMGSSQEALDDVSTALSYDPLYAMAYSNRAYMLTGLGRYDAAVSDATAAIGLEPELALAYANRAEAYFMMGNYDSAIIDSTRALSLDEGLSGTLIGRSFAYLANSNFESALLDAKAALMHRPGDIQAVFLRGMALLALTDGEDGREDLNRVIRSGNQALGKLANDALRKAEDRD